jgi:hypothetical protein
MAGAIDVDDQRCMIRGYRFSLPRLAIDLRPYNGVFKRPLTSKLGLDIYRLQEKPVD